MSIGADHLTDVLQGYLDDAEDKELALDHIEQAYRNVIQQHVEGDSYEVTLANIFEADSPEDAVGQMATWASDHAYQAGYRVTNTRSGQSMFIDAEDVDWNDVSVDE